MTVSPSEARRRALLAAARVTVSLSVVGCGPSAPTSGVPSEQVSVGDQPAAARGVNQALRPAAQGGPTCDTTPREAYSKDSLQCCRVVVDEMNERIRVAHEGKNYEPIAQTPLQQDCCSLAIEAADYQTGADVPFEYMTVVNCCMFGRDPARPRASVARSSQTPGRHICSPWGPPMPPAMPVERVS